MTLTSLSIVLAMAAGSPDTGNRAPAPNQVWDARAVAEVVREVFLEPLKLSDVLMTVETEEFSPGETPRGFIVHVWVRGMTQESDPYTLTSEILRVCLRVKDSFVRSMSSEGPAVERSDRPQDGVSNREHSMQRLSKLMGWQEQVEVPRRGGGTVRFFRDADGEVKPWNTIVLWELTGLPRVVGDI
ncbi:MAG: hypothetical protein GX464_03825 [Holophagae bacterium]|nr:hypothetical protein [Holophagae bacterium]